MVNVTTNATATATASTATIEKHSTVELNMDIIHKIEKQVQEQWTILKVFETNALMVVLISKIYLFLFIIEYHHIIWGSFVHLVVVRIKMKWIEVKMMFFDKLEGAAYRHPR